jgi:Protein of unknown function (DUF3152)
VADGRAWPVAAGLALGLAVATLGYAAGFDHDLAGGGTPAAAPPVARSAAAGLAAAPATDAAPAPPVSSGDAVPEDGTGRFVGAAGGTRSVGTGRLYRYRVEVEQGTGVRPADFAAGVDATLAHPRGWTGGGRWAFRRVPPGVAADMVVRLATPATVDRICGAAGLETNGEVSCRVGPLVIINLKRWRLGIPAYEVAEYRHLVVNHEVGHFLGFSHVGCPGPGQPAPVMMTQIFGLHGCRPNVWPYPATD